MINRKNNEKGKNAHLRLDLGTNPPIIHPSQPSKTYLYNVRIHMYVCTFTQFFEIPCIAYLTHILHVYATFGFTL